MKKLLTLLIVGLITVVVYQVGFKNKKGTDSLSEQSTKKVLNKGNGTEPEGLDPQLATGVPEHDIIVSLFEGLVSVHPKTLEPEPAIAKSWKISDDGLTYTFQLRKNAKWSNGDPITTQDFIYSFRRLVNPKTAAKYAYQGYYIKNGKAISKGKLKPEDLGVKAIDTHTLEITLEAPAPFFLGLLYHYSMYPVHQASVSKHGDRWTRVENIVTSGPFVLKEWKVNKVITVAKNDLYWDKDTVQLDEINYWPIENIQTEEKMFRAGKLDVTKELPNEKIPYWSQSNKKEYVQAPYLGSYIYRVNTTRKPLNDKRVRKALSLTIDRNQLVKYVTRGGQIPAYAFTPVGTSQFFPETSALYKKTMEERIVKAKQLLTEAGYPNGQDFPKVEILYNTSENHKKIAEAIQQMWLKNLGIKVGLFNQEWKVYLASETSLSYDISRAGWIGDYNDPLTFLDLFTSDGGNNKTGWKNSQYDDLIHQAKTESNTQKRLELFAQLEKILDEEQPFIPIYTYTRVYLKKSYVKGWYQNIQDYHPPKYINVDEKNTRLANQ